MTIVLVMGRLAPEALYGNEPFEERYVRSLRYRRNNIEPTSFHSPDGSWERAAQRAKIVDPDGSRAFAILRRMMADCDDKNYELKKRKNIGDLV
jgi:hypothetical protein